MLQVRAFNTVTKAWRWMTVPNPRETDPGSASIVNEEKTGTEWAQGWKDDGFGNIVFTDGDGDVTVVVGSGGIQFFDSTGQDLTMELSNGTLSIYKGGSLTVVDEIEGNTLMVSGGQVYMLNLPNANPNQVGALWNDGGTLKVSAG